jgi:hypothetical protein
MIHTDSIDTTLPLNNSLLHNDWYKSPFYTTPTAHQTSNSEKILKNWPHSGAVYTMDHEVGPGLCKVAYWLLKLSRDNFGLHQEKNGKGHGGQG